MYHLVLFVHVVLCFILIGLVLLQQGKGADMGAAFGGGSNTLFGAAGATTFLTRFTTGTAIAFMFTSIALVKLSTTMTATAANPLAGSVLEGAASAPAKEEKGEAPAPGAAQPPPAAQQQAAPAVVAPPAAAAPVTGAEQPADQKKE